MKYVAEKGIAPLWEAKTGHYVTLLAKAVAILGGLVLVTIGLITVVSIIGRELLFLGLGPIPGDFEIVEMGCAFAIFSFLPWCQLKSGHAAVDIFANFLGHRFNAFLSLLWDVVMAFASAVLYWRLLVGMTEKQSYEETTLILQIPLWVGYAAGLSVMSVLLITCLYSVWRSVNQLASVERSDR